MDRNWIERRIDGLRTLLRASLERENRTRLTLFWAAVVLLAMAVSFWPLLVSPSGRQIGDPDAQLGALSTTEKAQVRRPTAVETAQIAQLSLVRDPMRPLPPPPQSTSPAAANELFGVRPDRAPAFNAMTAELRSAAGECSTWIGANTGPEAPTAANAAQAQMDVVTGGARADRGVFHYHQGLILLCGPNAASAAKEFRLALEAYNRFRKDKGQALTPADDRRLAQYETVTRYGLALALLADGKGPEAVDKELVQALEAAAKAKTYTPHGPFVTLSPACDTGQECDYFDFSTAQVVNTRLFVWMRAGKPGTGYARVSPLIGGNPTYVAQYPALAANYGAVAATVGDVPGLTRLFQAVRLRLESGTAVAGWTSGDQRALARLAAAAVLTPTPIYKDGDAWWPRAVSPSRIRQTFDAKPYDKDETWFPPIELGDPGDAADIDLWLWVRRERALLEKAAYGLFREDGATIRTLGPGDRQFLERWRREITGRLGDVLLKRAEVVRRKEGLRTATPLLQLLGGRDFPFLVWAKARMSLAGDASPEVAIGRAVLFILVLLVAWWTHMRLAAGWARTFTRRHFEERTAREGQVTA